MSTPRILIIAGPNRAGKTTFAKTFLPLEAHCMRFLNADLIAAGLSPFAPEVAAVKSVRLMLQEMAAATLARESFAFETTLSGLSYIQHIKKWQKLGYHVSLFFLSLNSVEMAIDRVAQRVQQGGHNIPEEVVRRRFTAGLNNFKQRYRLIVNAWALYDNSRDEPNLIQCGENNGHE
ncbi:MAG: zeta toxin family protein [Gammaproteobacteria bacterium]|nr:zeta toxin family protein [Gammaproteobacteria bacterium]